MSVAPDPDALVTVFEAPSELGARAMAALLDDADVPAFVFPLANLPAADLLRGRTRGVHVQVAARDLERARAVLAEATREAADIDWDEVDVGEPEESAARQRIDLAEAAAARGLAAIGRWTAWGIILLILLAGVAGALRALSW